MDYRGAIVGLGNPGTKYDVLENMYFCRQTLKLAEEEGTATAQSS